MENRDGLPSSDQRQLFAFTANKSGPTYVYTELTILPSLKYANQNTRITPQILDLYNVFSECYDFCQKHLGSFIKPNGSFVKKHTPIFVLLVC